MKISKVTSFFDTKIDDIQKKIDEKYERVQKLRPIDDSFFEKLCEDPKVCEEIIQTILNDDIKVVSATPQKSIKNLQGRSVRVDALCIREDGSYCNVEMQRADNDNHFKRVRYNASCITSSITDPGTRFENVPELYVIYISEFDILEAGKTVYHQKTVIDEIDCIIDDGLYVIYVNTAVNDGSDIAELMQCFKQTHPNNPKFPKLSKRVDHFKNSEEGVACMCKIMDEVKNEGKLEGKIEIATNLFREGQSLEFVLSIIGEGISREDLQHLYNSIKSRNL